RRKRGAKSAAASQAAANRSRARGNAAVYPAAFPQPDLPPSLVRGRVGLAEALARTIPTRDVNDQAHAERDEDGLLLPAREVGAALTTPRRYPESHLNGRGVAIDSAFDELYERQKWLERDVGDVPGLSDARPVSASVQRAMGQAGSAKNLRVWLNGGKPR
ncbi:MAG TPA: hypothetical protein PLW65_25710, partial [Pseudomonadota bacterium]|nr:hypothetical protein [Pseudomonadota bacterium]